MLGTAKQLAEIGMVDRKFITDIARAAAQGLTAAQLAKIWIVRVVTR
jgi:hypothetical protein